MITVMKIGGSVLRDANSFRRVANIIKEKREKASIIVVLSALYGVTDGLIETAKRCLEDEKEIKEAVGKLKETHLNYLKELRKEVVREKAGKELGKKLTLLERFLYGIHYLRELNPRSKDMVQSFGERLAPIILHAFLEEQGIKAVIFDSERAGIVCTGSYEKCIAAIAATKENLMKSVLPALEDKVVLVTGYYGVDSEGNIKTFGRGGTDYSAGLIANCLDANLEIWKDVAGFMTANPKIVKGAKKIAKLSYSEAEELGYLGAKILHPKTIPPIRERGIGAAIKNIFSPKEEGTTICKSSEKSKVIVKSIAVKNNIAVVTVEGAAMVNTSGFAAEVFSIVGNAGVDIDLISTAETAISFSIDSTDLKKTMQALEQLKERKEVDKIIGEVDAALIGVVGEGMKETPGVAGKIFSALGRGGINVELISQGASAINITFIVKEKDAERAVQTIHEEFIGR